jgi:hypothetical protein
MSWISSSVVSLTGSGASFSLVCGSVDGFSGSGLLDVSAVEGGVAKSECCVEAVVIVSFGGFPKRVTKRAGLGLGCQVCEPPGFFTMRSRADC